MLQQDNTIWAVHFPWEMFHSREKKMKMFHDMNIIQKMEIIPHTQFLVLWTYFRTSEFTTRSYGWAHMSCLHIKSSALYLKKVGGELAKKDGRSYAWRPLKTLSDSFKSTECKPLKKDLEWGPSIRKYCGVEAARSRRCWRKVEKKGVIPPIRLECVGSLMHSLQKNMLLKSRSFPR